MLENTVATNYPKQKLLFYVAQDVDDAIRQRISRFIEKISASRTWVIGPPRVVNTVDQPENSSKDLPVETVGGELEIYSAMPQAELPRDIDMGHLDEVTALVEAVKNLSKEADLVFEFQLDDTFVGMIEDGKIDRTLQIGLIDEWRKHLFG